MTVFTENPAQRRRHARCRLLFLFTILCLLARPALALDIKTVRFGLYPDKMRVVVELSGQTDFRAFVLPEPWRLAVDLPEFDWQAGNPALPAKGFLSTMRQGKLGDGVSRLIFELSKPAIIKTAFVLPANGATPARLVVDLASATAPAATAQRDHVFGKLQNAAAPPPAAPETSTAPAMTPDTPAETAPATTAPTTLTPAGHDETPPPPNGDAKPDKQSRKKDERFDAVRIANRDGVLPVLPARKKLVTPYAEGRAAKPLIIVDPGHGGVDPGTHGPGTMVEKDVTLAAARELKRTLESAGRYRVLLTRDSDVYVGLYERVKFARKNKGDLFISLHADSSPVASTVGGASIYTLSDKASDAETAKLAQRENEADQIAGVHLRDQDADVANILVDLAMRDTMNQSKFFANMVTGNFKGASIPTLERTNRAAGFAVLKDPDMPSILVEMGFLSNPREARALAQPAFRGRLAQALTASVDTYFSRLAEK